MVAGEFEPLVDYENSARLLGSPSRLPTTIFPLLYVLGTRQQGEGISFPVEGVDGGSVSMLSVIVGEPPI